MNTDWEKQRIEAIKAAIEAAETAMLGIVSGSVLSFTLDTGQTRKVVTKLNVTELRNYISAQYSLLYQLEARVYGGSVTARPYTC